MGNHLDPGSTSIPLLDRLKINDEEAWNGFTRTYGPLIYSWCRHWEVGRDDSADIVQDVFRSVLLHIETFEIRKSGGSFRGWLWSITRNKVRDHVKVRAGKAQATGGSSGHAALQAVADVQWPADGESSSSGRNGELLNVLSIIQSEVKPTTFSAFWRSTIDGVDPSVVASELQISIHSVWQARSRLLRRARQLMNS